MSLPRVHEWIPTHLQQQQDESSDHGDTIANSTMQPPSPSEGVPPASTSVANAEPAAAAETAERMPSTKEFDARLKASPHFKRFNFVLLDLVSHAADGRAWLDDALGLASVPNPLGLGCDGRCTLKFNVFEKRYPANFSNASALHSGS